MQKGRPSLRTKLIDYTKLYNDLEPDVLLLITDPFTKTPAKSWPVLYQYETL